MRFALVVLLVVSGCSKKPYTSRRTALEAQLAALKRAEESAKKAPQTKELAKLTPPLVLEGPQGTGGNALILPFGEVARLAEADIDFLRKGQFGNFRSERDFFKWDVVSASGLSCAAEATRVLAVDDCGDEECRGEHSERCSTWLLGVQWVVFVDVRVDTDKFHKGGTFTTIEEFKARAIVVALTTGEVQGVIPFEGSNVNKGQTAMLARDVVSAFGPALRQLQDKLSAVGSPPPSGFAPFLESDAKPR